jgi:hypothetical protein
MHGLGKGLSVRIGRLGTLTHEFVIDKPDSLDGDRDRFIDEVMQLIVGYLMPSRSA